ncbi:hypothetical protein D9619_000075 [Psilocybe cf. subviscida]|uniref:Uncharacterized protein n=1 Tax=Psilocybe cf. subviscida TaxID=2480587 RepID=A0A8H5BE29_9AGAR|nr:hypothetical protein D9619_000075 [Psilocybe cf. subviscida]
MPNENCGGDTWERTRIRPRTTRRNHTIPISKHLMNTNYRGRSQAHTSRRFFLPFVALATLGLLNAPIPAMAAMNITIDNSDPSIIYSGSWEELPGELDFGKTHQLTGDPMGTAVFQFTGTAIYFQSPLWPFSLTTGISLDGEPPDTIFLQDPASVSSPNPDGGETIASAVVWGRSGLLDTLHTLTMSVVPASDGSQSFAVVDALIYTSDDILAPSAPSTPTTSSVVLSITSSQPTATSGASSGDTHQNKTGLSIALGIVCTVFGLLVLYALRWLWRRRARRLAEEASAGRVIPDHDATPEMAEAGGGAPANGSRRRAYASIQRRSQKELAAAAAAAAALEEEEEEREREREKERERRRRRNGPGPSGLRHSTVADGDDEHGDGSSSSDAGYESPRHSRSRQSSVRRKLSAGASDAMLGTILERRESYAGGNINGGGGGEIQAEPPWREVDAGSRYPSPNSNSKSRTSQGVNGQQRTSRLSPI